MSSPSNNHPSHAAAPAFHCWGESSLSRVASRGGPFSEEFVDSRPVESAVDSSMDAGTFTQSAADRSRQSKRSTVGQGRLSRCPTTESQEKAIRRLHGFRRLEGKEKSTNAILRVPLSSLSCLPAFSLQKSA